MSLVTLTTALTTRAHIFTQHDPLESPRVSACVEAVLEAAFFSMCDLPLPGVVGPNFGPNIGPQVPEPRDACASPAVVLDGEALRLRPVPGGSSPKPEEVLLPSVRRRRMSGRARDLPEGESTRPPTRGPVPPLPQDDQVPPIDSAAAGPASDVLSLQQGSLSWVRERAREMLVQSASGVEEPRRVQSLLCGRRRDSAPEAGRHTRDGCRADPGSLAPRLGQLPGRLPPMRRPSRQKLRLPRAQSLRRQDLLGLWEDDAPVGALPAIVALVPGPEVATRVPSRRLPVP